MKYRLMVVGFFIMLVAVAFAGVSRFGVVEGSIVSFDNKTVTLELRDGRQKVVKRETIPSHYELRQHNQVKAYIDMSTIFPSDDKNAKKK